MEFVIIAILGLVCLAVSMLLGDWTQGCLEFFIGTYVTHHVVHVPFFLAWIGSAFFGPVTIPFDIIATILKSVQ